MLTGAFVGSDVASFARADAMERWQDAPMDVQNVFVTWEADLEYVFDRVLPEIVARGRVPLVTWEPFTDGENTPTDLAERVVAGEYDDYLARFRDRLREWVADADGVLDTADDRRCYLRFAHEPNGDWYPWAPATGGTAGEYVACWRTVYDAVMSEGLEDAVSWVWAVNHVDVGGVAAESLYPGDDYVDWAGVDGFNWGASQSWSSWQPPREVFDDMLGRVAEFGKPMCIPEYASTSETVEGHSVSAKNGWLRELFAYASASPVELLVYFDIDKETDWAVFGGERGDMMVTIDGESYSAYSAYGRGIGDV